MEQQQAAPAPPTVDYVPLTAAAARALVEWSGAVPNLAGCAELVGTHDPGWRVPGGVRLPLPVSRHAGRQWWWIESHDAFCQWWAHEAVTVRRRWPLRWQTGGGLTPMGRVTHVMGIVNVTPDSFSDGGQYLDPARAVAAARAEWRDGATWVDVGGESTRPGHVPVAATSEWGRVEPVLSQLTRAERTATSLDTRHPEVAAQAAQMGVAVLNDVSCLEDPEWLGVLADVAAGYVLMYNRPPGAGRGLDLVDMLRRLSTRLEQLEAAGVDRERVVVDPGLGFAYGVEDNLAVLKSLALFRIWDRPLLVGPSRKRFLGRVTGRDASARDVGSALAGFWAIGQGADVIRLHQVSHARDAARMGDALAFGQANAEGV